MKRAVICFTRVPVPGKTKTRLMPLLGGKNCARLHTAFLQDLAGVYRQLDADLFVAYAPEPHWEPLREIFPFARDFLEQQGAGLGQRMDNALRWVLAQGYAALCADRKRSAAAGAKPTLSRPLPLWRGRTSLSARRGWRILPDWDEAPLHRNF